MSQELVHGILFLFFSGIVGLAVPWTILWGLVSLCSYRFCPERYRPRWRQFVYGLAIIGVITCLIEGITVTHALFARAAANRVVAAVQDYKKQHGRYLENFEETGTSLGEDGGPYNIFYTVDSDKRHTVAYHSVIMPFTWNSYEFEKGSWEFWED